MAKILLSAQDLSYAVDSAAPLFDSIHLSLQRGDRIALVGRNGSGKSTLLKLLAGQITPTQGHVSRYASLAYVPQVIPLSPGVQSKPMAGTMSETVLEMISAASEDWWRIDEILSHQFDTRLDLSQPVVSLSGGELTKLLLAMAMASAPDILLLDEPTNHLDLRALDHLRACLGEFQGSLVLVSHKPYFLDQVVTKIWDLTPQALQEYGGNYSHYRAQVQAQRRAAERSHDVAQKLLKRAKATALAEQQRAAHSHRSGEQKAANGSMGKMAKHYFANRASGTAGTAAKRNQTALAQASQRVTETKLKTTKATIIQLEEVSLKRRTLVDVRDGRLSVGGHGLIHDLQLQVVSGDRVVITGSNGTGKSSLVKALLAQTQGSDALGNPTETVRLTATYLRLANPIQVVSLDQTYGLVDRRRTVLENMQAANPGWAYQALRQQLGHFRFWGADVEKSAAVLSGGELARLALAMISIATIDWLILDEPTNNLDIDTVETMVDALKHYRGALWVISHDVDFLSQIDLHRAFHINHGRLQSMAVLPQSAQAYYDACLAAD